MANTTHYATWNGEKRMSLRPHQILFMPKETGWFYITIVNPAVLKRDNYTCIRCGSKKNLEVSHNFYGNKVTIKDLETLCRGCHKKKDYALGLFSKNYSAKIKGRIQDRTAYPANGKKELK